MHNSKIVQRTILNSERIKIKLSTLTSRIKLTISKNRRNLKKSQESDPRPHLDKTPLLKILKKKSK